MARKPNRITKRIPATQTVLSPARPEKEVIDMNCKECGRLVEDVSGLKAVTCSRCVMGMIDPPPAKVKPEEVRPRGWQFMNRYVSPTGKVYSKGKEVDETPSHTTKPIAAGPGKRSKSGSRKNVPQDRTNPGKRGRKPKR